MFGLPEALMSFVRRQVGLRTDAASDTGSLHAKVANIWSVSSRTLTENIKPKFTVASDNLKISSDTLRFLGSTTYAKIKEIVIACNGIIRVSFAIKSNGDTAYGQVYVNGEAAGTERTGNSSDFTTYSEDIHVHAGDMVQVYVRHPGAPVNNASIQNFRLYFDFEDGDGAVTID